jgi:predicted  nucleic acid-binding Zn-ribbon protein
MVPILAGFLTEPSREGATSGELATWGESVSRRYAPLSDAAERLWKGMTDDTQDAALVQAVLGSGRDLVRYTQVAFTPGSVEQPRDEDRSVTQELVDVAVTKLEGAILALDRLRRMRALRDVTAAAMDLERAAENLEQLLDNPDADALELLARLDQLERVMERLMQAASRLDPGGLQEFLNGRENEVQNLMDEIRKAIAEGRMDEARTLMERLSEMVSEMSQGMQDEMNRRSQQGSDAMDAAEDLKRELQRLEDEQRRLKSEVQALREQDDAAASKKAADLWAKIQRLSSDVATRGATYGEGLEAADRPFYEVERTRSALESQAEFHEAVTARDLRGSREGIFEADQRWMHVQRTARSEASRRRVLAGPQATEVDAIRAALTEIALLLEQLNQSSESLDPEARQRSQELEAAQRDLENQLMEARRSAAELAREFPVQPEGMRESLQEASERMGESGDDLGAGRAMQAEGGQGVAAERLREARESLEQAMQQAKQQQQSMQPGGQGDQQQAQDGENQSGTDNKPMPMEIPGREEFRTPEAYRRALLDGMEGEVPEEYRALKKRYYEELVHQ